VPFDRGQDPRRRQVETARRVLAADEKRLGAGARHDAVEEMERLGDRARRQILFERERLLHQRVRKAERVLPLRHADLAEIRARGAVTLHVVARDQGKAGIGAAGAIGMNGVLREAREARQRPAEGIDVIGIAGNAEHELGIAALHRARGAAQADDSARTAERHGVEPARAETEMLGEADRRVGAKREAGDRKAIDIAAPEAGTRQHFAHRPADPPMRRVGGVAPVRDGDRHGRDDTVIGAAPRACRYARHGHGVRFFMARVSA